MAVSEIVWPWQTGLLLDTVGTVGAVPIAKLALEVALPQALVAVNETVGEPALAKQMAPGTWFPEDAGAPPGKVHNKVTGAPQSCTEAVGDTHWPAQMPESGDTDTCGAAFTVTTWLIGGTLQLLMARNWTV
jgi:hypothetical protein